MFILTGLRRVCKRNSCDDLTSLSGSGKMSRTIGQNALRQASGLTGSQIMTKESTPMPAPTQQDKITILQAESERITQYLTHLPPQAWQKPSACSQWQVQDVVAHLIGVANFYTDNVSRGLQGDAAPPPGRPPAGSMTAAAAAAGIAQRATAEREALGDRLLTTFKATNERLCHLLAGLSPEEQQKPCYHPGGITLAHQFADLRLKELALHEWDIRSQLEPHAQLAPASYHAILRLLDEAIASGSLHWGFSAGKQLAAPIRYRFTVTEPVPYQIDIVVTGDTARQETMRHTESDITFQCNTETFVLLVCGRLPIHVAMREGRITIEGDHDLATAFAQWFKGI